MAKNSLRISSFKYSLFSSTNYLKRQVIDSEDAPSLGIDTGLTQVF